MDFLGTNYNLNQATLQQEGMQVLAAAPSTPVIGQVYFDSALNAAQIYNGTSWVNLRNPIGTASGDLSGSFPSPIVAWASQAFSYTGIISPTTLVANQNDYAPTGLATASVIRLSASTAVTITGLAGGATGRILKISNVGTFNITLSNQNVLSNTANRFLMLQDKILTPNESCQLLYDLTSGFWRVSAISDEIIHPASSTANALTLWTDATGRNIKNSNLVLTEAASEMALSTSDLALSFSQTGDTYGGTRLQLLNRNGANGAMFEQLNGAGIDLVDFIFKTQKPTQFNFRHEARASSMLNTANVAEFQLMNNLPSSVWFTAFGPAVASLPAAVGIGKVNPAAALDVVGNIVLTGTVDGRDISVDGPKLDVLVAANSSVTQTTNYTILATNGVVHGDATAGAITMTLPTLAGVIGQRFVVTKIDASSNFLNVASAETILGMTSPLILTRQGMSITLFATSTFWELI